MASRAVTSQEWVLAQQEFPEADQVASERLSLFAGSIAVRGEAELRLDETETNQSTLLSTLQRARLGDPEAIMAARMNVETDAAERMFKVAHQTKVPMQFAGSRLMQNGICMTDVHRNTLQHMVLIPEMQVRTKHETKNVMLFEALHARGILQQYDALVFSPSSTTMSRQQKKDYGQFLDAESCSIQLLATDGNQASLQTAFVAGKTSPQAERHDIKTIKLLAEKQGIALNAIDGTDMIQYLMLVPKGSLPGGVTDVVRLYDEAAGGTFYGQAEPPRDYETYATFCEQRNRQFDETVDAIMAALLAECHMYTSPLEAIMRLDEISERFCVKYSVSNRDVNARVFGATSAAHIEAARHELENGNEAAAEKHLVKAQATADSSSCPLFKGVGQQNENSSDGNNAESSDKKGKRMMSCPYCSARVYDDPCARVLSCWDCKARVVNGQVRSKGDGGSKARAARAAKARQETVEAAKVQAMAEAAVAAQTVERSQYALAA